MKRLVLLLTVILAACSDDNVPDVSSEKAAADALQALQGAANAADGKALYAACAACHGAAGEGNSALNSPSLVNQQDWYLERQLNAFRSGVRGSDPKDGYGAQMQAIAKTLPDEAAVKAVVSYISDLKAKPAEKTLDGNVKRGADYYSNLCGACHGPEAEGNDKLQAPALAGVDDWYLLKQFNHFRDGIRGADEADRYGYQMGMMGKTLPDDDVAMDVIAYIQSLAD
ncbi:Cytochrome c4 [Zhongshania aliphaticivorans]|uniref:Cytochrome c4 n=1 Tax=Zhongshania aliphaticivorans TaxID=1470434 RepID=A0A5S9QH82_9GAMM|nr:c-type cytochrome [Zhongshania aliphaticivorans]CAA0110210.1 Cytochrome c4 [Zhongshania aliphaticivorans]CAA0118035.1 Cytochrome c4 [Zhongshania aliphaticivorans]CAA0121949.1 Cytochrome c4 [Zhongshania aliphaticivorans]